jgi:hypothetical protein
MARSPELIQENPHFRAVTVIGHAMRKGDAMVSVQDEVASELVHVGRKPQKALAPKQEPEITAQSGR